MKAFVQIVALIFLWGGLKTIHAQTQIGADVYGLVSGSEMGSSVALSANGMRMVCGSHEHLGERGMVRIYEYNTTTSTWDLMQDIIGAATDDEFGYAVDISADGNRIVVGAPQFNKPVNNEGFFSIYEYNGSSWTLMNTFVGGAAVDRFGTSVAISDDGATVAAGGMWYDNISLSGSPGLNQNHGYTKIYRYNGATWVQLGVDIEGTNFGENAGYDIDLSQNGATIIIGSWGYNGSVGVNQGGARIYDWNGSTWVLRGAIIEGANAQDYAGMAVAISTNGNRIAIGAPWNDAIATDAGHARIFDWNGSAWIQVGATLTGVDANDWFGHSLDFNGDNQIAIGAPFASNPAGTAEVYCYNTTRGEWVQVGGDDIVGSPASGDGSGYAVAIARDTNIIAVGAHLSSDFAANAGKVRVFELDNPAMRVYGNNTLIENGDISPVTTDDTDFGGVSIVGGMVSHTFTIENAALNADLLLNGAPTIAITGAHTSDFTVTSTPTTSLSACGDITTFTIGFSPSAIGLREATVSVANNTTGQNPYTFSIQGTGGEPATGLAFDGSGDYVNFNSIADDMVGKTAFTIQTWVNATSNVGVDNIFLASRPGAFLVPSISIVEFYLLNGVLVIETGGRTINTGVNIANTGWRQITVTNDANRIVLYIDGQYTMEESVLNAFAFRVNDRWRLGRNTSNTFPYYFTGTLDEVRVWDRALCPTEILGNINCELMGNEANLIAYYKLNQGLRGLSNASVDTMIDMTSNANTGDLFNFSLRGTDSNWGEGNPTVSSTTCVATLEPEIEVSGNGITITDGDITPDIVDDTYFGATAASSPITKTFTINNTGLGSLELFQNISITGIDVADFTITMGPASTTLAANTGTTTFIVSFDPTGLDVSTRTATINVFSTDCDETVYNFDVSGDAIGLPATGLTFDNSNAYIEINSVADDMVGKTGFTMEAWVNSLSTSDRDAVIACNGSGNGDIFLLVLLNGVLNIKMGATFYSTGILIANTGWRHIATTYDGTTAVVYLDGIYVVEYVGVVAPFAANHRWSIGQEFDNNTSDRFSGTMDEVRIWDRALCAAEIRGQINCELTGSEANLMAYYQLNQGYIGMNNTVDTAIDLTINNNTGNLLNFALTGNTENWNVGNTAIATTACLAVGLPEIEVTGNSTIITDGSTTISLIDHTEFESATLSGGILSTTRTYTISNTSASDMYIASLNITGANAADFTIVNNPTPMTLVGGASMSFTVTFNPTVTGFKNATINIVSTDCDETLYSFDIGARALGIFSDVRGQMISLNGTNEYINVNGTAAEMLGATQFTIESWIKPNAAQNNNDCIFTINRNGGGDIFVFYLDDGILTIKDANAVNSFGTIDLRGTGWHHVAVTFDNSNFIVYLDGVQQGSTLAGSIDLFASDNRWSIGHEFNFNFFGLLSRNHFRGELDEVRVWRDVRTQQEIREQMHISLTGVEDNLAAYFQFDNDAGNTVNDGIGNNGTAINTPTYFASEVAVGGGASNTQNVLAAAIAYDFVGTDLEITFTGTVPGNEVVVSKIETQNPYNESTGILANNTAGYWVVNNYGNNTGLNASVKFNYNNGSVTDNIPSNHIVHKRGSRDWNTIDWSDLVATAVSTAVGDNHVRIDGITSFSQLDVTAIRSSLPIELLHFDAKRQNNEEVVLEWSTANETNNQNFEIERMLEDETEFTVVGLVAGNGTTTSTSYYDLIDNNSYTKVSYYRLKQYDFDGSVSYSETRAVKGVEILTTNQMNVSVYPNPVTNNSLKIRFDELPENVHTAHVNISNINGQILYQTTEEVQSYQILPIQYVNQLTPAVYFIQIRLDNGAYCVEKFIKK